MTRAARQDSGHGYRLEFAQEGACLHAHLTGHGGVAEVEACWKELAGEARRRGASSLLLVDELSGRPLHADEWQQLVDEMQGQGLEDLRIAHVKPWGVHKEEHCEIFAREAGLQARVFDDEAAAGRWLRYGER